MHLQPCLLYTSRMSYKVAKRIMRKEQLDRLDGFENESEVAKLYITMYLQFIRSTIIFYYICLLYTSRCV